MSFSFFGKALHSPRGFSLVELMIGGSIIAGAGVTATVLFSKNMAAQKGVSHLQELQNYHSNLAKALSNTRNCNATFKASSGQPELFGVTSIHRHNDTNNESLLSVKGATVNPVPLIGTNSYIGDAGRSWKVDDISLVSLTPYDPLAMSLTQLVHRRYRLDVTYSINKSSGSGQPPALQTVVKSIYFGAKYDVDGGTPKFVSCHDINRSSVENLENNICSTALTPPASSAGAGRVYDWDINAQNCKPATVTCPSGSTVRGVKSDGSVDCVALTQSFTPSSNPYVCKTGTFSRLIYTSGQLGVTCTP